jgi:hypothetical protein
VEVPAQEVAINVLVLSDRAQASVKRFHRFAEFLTTVHQFLVGDSWVASRCEVPLEVRQQIRQRAGARCWRLQVEDLDDRCDLIATTQAEVGE